MTFLLGVTLVCIMTPAKGDSTSTVTPVTTQIILDDHKRHNKRAGDPSMREAHAMAKKWKHFLDHESGFGPTGG